MRKVNLIILILSVLFLFGTNSGNAQDFTIVVGQDKTFTEFNYHHAWFENCYENIDPTIYPIQCVPGNMEVPKNQYAISEDNYASVSVIAQPGSNGRAYAEVGIKPNFNLMGYTLTEAANLPVKVTFDFNYTIKANYGIGSSDGEIRLIPFAMPWYDIIGNVAGIMGERSEHAIETYDAKLGDLQYVGFLARCHAHANYNSGSAIVTINSIKVEFDHSGERLEAYINIDPNTLNLRSRGNFITCYISFPNPDFVEDIDFSTIELATKGTLFYPLAAPSGIITNEDGIKQLMIKFKRNAIQNILTVGEVEFTVKGKLNSGRPFSGKDKIRAINP